MKRILLGVLSVAIVGGVAYATTSVTNSQSSVRETPASTSPISVTTLTKILNAAPSTGRHSCSFQNSGTAACKCCYGSTATSGAACSTTAYDFVVGAQGSSGGVDGLPTAYTIGPQTNLWNGVIYCTSGGTCTLAVGCY